METVDKIVVVLTPKYVDIVTGERTEHNNACKVIAEYNYISNILHNSFYSSDQLLVITSNVKNLKIPHAFEKEDLYEYPVNHKLYSNGNIGIKSPSRDIITALINK